MKLTAVLLLGAFMQVAARTEGQTVTLKLTNAPMKEVFREIQKQTGLNVMVDETILEKAGRVTLDVRDMPVNQVLTICLKNKPLTYTIIDGRIVVKPKSTAGLQPADDKDENPALPPPIDVKGRVVNEKGEPVAGASVVVKGDKNRGTITDLDGFFELKGINEDAIIVISGVSVETRELKVEGRTDIGTIITKIKVAEGEEITISTGYQRISKERFVGSYSQLDSAAYERRAGMGIIERLDGTVTGVLFDKKASGALAENLTIRGLSTINSARLPLIIVDDFPFRQNLNNINPNDIQSITVLKDAAAISIWGAQAGNGVIVITTKKGGYNKELQVNVSSNITIWQKPNLYYYPQMRISDFIDVEEFLFNKGFYNSDLSNTHSWPTISPVIEMLAQKRAGLISASDSATQINSFRQLDVRRDLNKYAYRNPVSQQHYINLNGGNNVISYTFSGGYNHTLNGTRNSKGDYQYTMNSSVKLRPVKNLEFTSTIGIAQSTQQSGSFFLPGRLYPYAQLADGEGKALAIPYSYRLAYLDTVGAGKLLDGKFRPLDEPGLVDNNNKSRFISLNFGLSYKLASWLQASIRYQFSSETANGRNYNSLGTFYTRSLINQFTNLSQTAPSLRYPVPMGGILDKTTQESIFQNMRSQLNFNKTISGRHNVNAIIAAEISEQVNSGATTSRFYNYDNKTGSYQPNVDYVTIFQQQAGNSGTVPNGNQNGIALYNRFVSFLANASYSFNDIYTIYGSGRKDGSNIFGVNTNKRWKPLWSAGASWNISKEKFYRIKWMPSLRIKLSYGYAGNPGNVTGLPTIIYLPSPAYLTNLPAADLRDAPNPDLKWEKVGIINAAVEFGLFNNRISGNIDVWHKKSSDLISDVPMPQGSGVRYFTTNTANLKSNGFDVNLNIRNIEWKNFSWQMNFGLSYAKTIVSKYLARPRTGSYTVRDFILYSLNPTEGQIIYGLASYRWAGLDPLTGNPRGYLNKQVSTDYNAILNDTVGNQVFHGSAVPLYFGFIGNAFSWKNFSISANFSYRLKFYFRKPTINYTQLVNSWSGHADYALRWQKPGDEKFTNIPSFIYPLDNSRDEYFQYSEINVLRGDNLRLQDIRVQYNFKGKNLPFKAMTVFMYVNNLNLILWRKNKSNLDPDFIGVSNLLSTPTPKTLAGGINISF